MCKKARRGNCREEAGEKTETETAPGQNQERRRRRRGDGEDKRDEEKPRLREADKKIRRETQRKRPLKEGAPREKITTTAEQMMLVVLRDDVWSKRKTEGGGWRRA